MKVDVNAPQIFRRQLAAIIQGDFDDRDLLTELQLLRAQATRRQGEASRTNQRYWRDYWRGNVRLVDMEIRNIRRRRGV